MALDNVKPVATRQAFGEALGALGREFSNVVVLEADLGKSTKSDIFGKAFPERYFELGIAEQNMLGVAAGLAMSGHPAFCCSFACFVAGRFETIKISIAYAEANVKIVGTHAGVGIGPDGYSQMGLEDIGLMRTLPKMQVFQPADDIETHAIVRYLCQHEGPAYLRLTRQNLKRVHSENHQFEPGKVTVLKDGSAGAIFATGGTVMHALAAAERLGSHSKSIAVVNVSSLKPFDEEAVRAWGKKVPWLLSAEDHSVIGGLGDAMAAALASVKGAAPLYKHGLHDVFGESGSPEALYKKFELDAEGIERVAARWAASVQ